MTSFHRIRPLLAAVGFFAVLGGGSTAQAQDETVYIGGSGSGHASSAAVRNSVQVDMSVLDDIGGRPISQSLLPPPGGSLNGQRVTLSPPGSATARKPQTPRRAATNAKPVATSAKPAAPRKTPAPATKAAASASVAPASPPPAPASTEPPPPPAQIDLATAMPPPLPEAKPAPAAVKAPEPARAAAPRDLKPAPSPTPVLSTMAAPEPARPAPAAARIPEPVSEMPAATPAAVVTPVAAAPAPVVAAAPVQVAALSPARQTGAGPQSLRIPFGGEAAVLPEPSKGELKQIAGSLSKDPALRVQVMAYASGSDDGGKARRLSLSRALAVRTYLIEQGIGSTRIDVRALGNTAEGGPSDRVDLVVVSR